MDVRNEVKSLIAKKGSTIKEVCEKMSMDTGKKYVNNNISNKLRRNTIKFSEVELMLKQIGYKIEFVEDK